MIKVLYIVPNLYASSGVTKVILNYISNLNVKMFKIDFLVLDKSVNNCEEEVKKYGCKIFYLNNTFKNFLKLKKEVYNFYINNNYDIIELHAPNLSFIFLKEAKKANIKKRIVHAHSSVKSLTVWKNIIWSLLNIRMKTYANYYFSCSESAFEYWFGEKVCKVPRGHIITNGEDVEKIRFNKVSRESIRKKMNLDNHFVIGFVGRISKEKNIAYLLNVFKKLDSDFYKLVFVGDIMIKGFEQKCKRISKNIILTGYQKNVVDYYCAFDLLVLPSRKEGLPTSIVEAQLCGLNCILSDTITREVDIGKVKFLPLKQEKWINYIEKKKCDEKERAESVDRNKYNIKQNAKNLEKIYLKIQEGDNINDI